MKRIRIICFSIILFFCLSSSVYGVEVTTFKELTDAIASEAESLEISLGANFEFDSKIEIKNKEITIEGNGHTITRNENFKLGLFDIDENSKLNLNNVIIDGNASDWVLDMENQAYVGKYVRVPVIVGENDVQASESLIKNKGELNIYKTEIKNVMSTVSGNVIYNYKDLNIEESIFTKNYANNKSIYGNVVYSGAGTNVKVTNSRFIENVLGNNSGPSSGSCFFAINAESLYIGNNCYFEKNFAQSNASVLYAEGTVFELRDSKFLNNGVGNDSGVCCIDTNDNLKDKKIIIDNCMFDGNYGLSMTSQSMAGVLGTSGTLKERLDIDITNSEFCNNVASVGVISNHGGESSKIYFNIDNCNFHDNKNTLFNSQNGNFNLKNCMIENNGTVEGYNRPSVAWLYSESVFTIEDTIIRNNVSENSTGSTIKVRGAATDVQTTLILKKGTEIYNNKGDKGGAIYIYSATDDSLAKVIIEDGASIYNNTANVAGDDIYIDCPDKDYSNIELVLIDAEGMEINGINNWFYDYDDSRFTTSDTVTVYDETKDRDVLALKAAGVNKITYETFTPEGLKQTEELYLKSNEEKNITIEEPQKDGYEFIGWNTKEDGTGTLIKPGNLYNGYEGYTLYAQYKKIEEPVNNVVNNTVDNVNNNIVGNNVTNTIANNTANVVNNVSGTNIENNSVGETLSNVQKVKVANTNNNDYNVLIIIGICFIIIGTGVIIYGNKTKRKE